MKKLKVKVGPQVYQYYPGAIDLIPEILEEHQAKKILIVHGTVSWEKAEPKLSFLNNGKQEIFYHQYTGECSYYGANLIKDKVEQNGIDFIIGVGGGKLSDVVGYAAHISNVKYGVIPTLASNCAPWTPLSVMYKESGEAEGKSEHYLRQAEFLITDPTLVIDSPVRYFIAGLADTLAKWYEAELILAQDELQDEPFLELSKFTAQLCKKAILEQSEKAIEDMKKQEVTDEFVHCSEIVFAVAGLCGGFGDKYGRNAAAHAMHDAIAKFIPESHAFLHGEKVAYGIFYQLALEERWEVIDELIPFYEKLHLPKSLHDMKIFPKDNDVIDKIVKFIDSKEKVHLIPITVNEDRLKDSIYKLEEYLGER